LRIKLHDLFCLLFIRLSWSHERILLYPSLQSTIHWNSALLCFVFSLFFPFQLIFFFCLNSFFNIKLFFYLIITLSWHDLQSDPHPRLLGLALQLDSRLLGLALQPYPPKPESCKFNNNIIIKNIIICIINIIIFIIMNIANIIINKFKKHIISYRFFFAFFCYFYF